MSVAEDSRGWWAISGDALMGMLRRVADGEDPAAVYADEEANCEVEDVYSVDGDAECLCFGVGGRRVPPSHKPCPRHGDQTMWEME